MNETLSFVARLHELQTSKACMRSTCDNDPSLMRTGRCKRVLRERLCIVPKTGAL